MSSAHDSLDTRIFAKECRSLAATGYEVVLLAQHDQSEEVVDGVTIRGLPAPEGRWERMSGTTRRLLRRALREDADLYHFHDPELAPVGLWLKLTGRTVVWDVHEDLPKQIMHKEWIPGPLRWLVSATARLFEGLLAEIFDAVVAATPSIGERFDGARVRVVNNYPRLGDLAPAANDRGRTDDGERCEVVYTGSITRIRGIRQMLAAVDHASGDRELRLAMAGRFSPPELRDEVALEPGWSHVEFHGWVSQDEVFRLLRRARAGLVVFQPAPNHVEAQPNKLFEYMGAGLPVIASDFPLWRKLIVENVRCGLVVDPTSPAEIAEGISWILRNPTAAEEMGRRGREAVEDRFNWKSEEEKLIGLYEELRVTA